MSFVHEEINKEGPVNTNSTKCAVDVKTDVEPTEHDVLIAKDDFTDDLLTNLSKNGDHVSSSIVLFSLTLSNFRAEKGFSDIHVGINDAIGVLLKAPMLVDLSLWTCWDYKFATSLGPLVMWLLSNVTTKELLCFVIKDGKVLRLDHSAIVDSFLESFLHGSSFVTTVKLISLIALYGGEQNVPLSLLNSVQNLILKARRLHQDLFLIVWVIYQRSFNTLEQSYWFLYFVRLSKMLSWQY
nr:histidine kinase-like ATPase, C-terminal domain-containing protein [Tanacetum cinerariifolium]